MMLFLPAGAVGALLAGHFPLGGSCFNRYLGRLGNCVGTAPKGNTGLALSIHTASPLPVCFPKCQEMVQVELAHRGRFLELLVSARYCSPPLHQDKRVLQNAKLRQLLFTGLVPRSAARHKTVAVHI